MKKLIILTIVAGICVATTSFAGVEVSSKQPVAPAPPPPAPEFFRPNEFDIGAFGSYATFVNTGNSRFANGGGNVHGWGGGMDFTYWFPWKYAGVRFQGAGFDFSGSDNGFSRTVLVPGFAPVSVHGGGGSVAGGVITADVMMRLPLDSFWPSVHLAPYVFGGFGGILLGSGGEGRSISESFTVTNNATGETHDVTFTGRRVNTLRNNIGSDRVLGHIGGGMEYRFTPHIGLFGEAAYVIPNGASNNFVQVNFGLRYAF